MCLQAPWAHLVDTGDKLYDVRGGPWLHGRTLIRVTAPRGVRYLKAWPGGPYSGVNDGARRKAEEVIGSYTHLVDFGVPIKLTDEDERLASSWRTMFSSAAGGL